MSRFNFPENEENILKFWQENDIFEKSVNKDAPHGDYVFYDGPPFATGLPHYGHILASIIKDALPRYQTMQGKRVERRWGWDCHGLPIENIVEKELNLETKKAIEDYGVDRFNDACRSTVLRYADEWKKIIPRIGRWVDMSAKGGSASGGEPPSGAYLTMNPEYMESIWWVFKTLWDKNLIYRGYKSMHLCPRCETTLSNFEVTQGYKDVTDLSVTIKFPLADNPELIFLAWTTTPWTLPGNVALAVNENIQYVKVVTEKEQYILAEALVPSIFENITPDKIEKINIKDFIGKKYLPLFNYYQNAKLENSENLYTVVHADFVSTTDGTGIVHIAPAFGEDDMLLGQAKKLAFIQHVTVSGEFTKEVTDFTGAHVKPKNNPSETDQKVIDYLQTNNKLFASAAYTHSYPHCWRCDTPLINYASDSWFVKVTEIKTKLLECNSQTNWVPEFLRDGRFGNWLEGAHDWAISRSRYWGAPLPVWMCSNAECKHTQVIGSIEELEKLSGAKVTDLHKHIIDKLAWECPKCHEKMHRIPEVLDCWFESGAMPYAQAHYPFENKEVFEKNFPAQFIAEGIDQTRGWFYTLMVLSTALFEKPAFKNVIVNGIILAENGQKMSKRLKNYPDPMEIVSKYSADAMRYYLLTSPASKADDLRFSEKGVDEVFKKICLTLWNVYTFYEMYENDAVVNQINLDTIPSPTNRLDQWIIAKLNVLTREVSRAFESYDMPNATRPLAKFVDELSTWYLRRSRDRFKGEDETDSNNARTTIYYVLLKFSQILAPSMPFLAETLYLKLKKNRADWPESVHLTNWPQVTEALIDETMLAQMDATREIVELGHALRAENALKIRQPLTQVVYQMGQTVLPQEYLDIIAEELNVKAVTNATELPTGDNFKTKTNGNLTAVLDTTMTPELKQEGLYRELVRHINSLRKTAELTIQDRVAINYDSTEPELNEIFVKYVENFKKDTLAHTVASGKIEVPENFHTTLDIDGKIINIYLSTQ